jgi:glycosyltransferase involved in cell wall biosynthesis
MTSPHISICIPAYKKPEFVVRCLQSITQQSYKDVEVVISDDSPDEDIKVAIEPFRASLSIFYYHNSLALKSPKNWNAALDKARGDLVLLMHQDDWFFSNNALQQYKTVFDTYPKVDFVFCRNTAIDETGKEIILQARPKLINELSKKPDHLLLAQVIGPPSNTMVRKNVSVRYDENFIWLVDVDYYVRLLKTGYKYHYINQHLVNIGLHEDQTTAFCRANRDIIFKENILYAGKLKPDVFKDVLIFDYYWRLLRNYKIKTSRDIVANGVHENQIPKVITHLLYTQSMWSLRFLRNGVASKTAMALSYFAWLTKRKIA